MGTQKARKYTQSQSKISKNMIKAKTIFEQSFGLDQTLQENNG